MRRPETFVRRVGRSDSSAPSITHASRLPVKLLNTLDNDQDLTEEAGRAGLAIKPGSADLVTSQGRQDNRGPADPESPPGSSKSAILSAGDPPTSEYRNPAK